ncbi:MAG: tyrosine-protein phosphatase [Coriobacteriales bacterium]|nr:tyrosine-protein phosphatase [Coriobacteriales bacterium]
MHNTRDLGYLSNCDGQRVAPRRLIRSGALRDASEPDIDVLIDEYEVRTVIDLRTPEERENRPDPEEQMSGLSFIEAPILGTSALGLTREKGLIGMARMFKAQMGDPKKLMAKFYPKMLLGEMGIKGYKRFFETLANNEQGSVLWHCSAGKDRAGLASVLLLHVLGVPQQAILSDYLATNQFLAGRADDLSKLVPAKYLTPRIEKAFVVFNSADQVFLRAGIKGIEKEYGSTDGYLRNALDVDDDMRKLLRNKYLL